MSRSLPTPICFLCLPLAAVAHPLPDGWFDRGTQVTVYPDRVQIVYKLIVAESTIRAELKATAATPATDSKDLYRQYLPLVAEAVRRNVAFKRNGTQQPLEQSRAEVVHGRHHTRFEVELLAALPRTGRIEIEIRDRAFPGRPGLRRMAVKGRGVNVASPAKPDLLRVPQKKLSDMTPVERIAAGRLTAIVRGEADSPAATKEQTKRPTESARDGEVAGEPESETEARWLWPIWLLIAGAVAVATFVVARFSGFGRRS